MSILLPSLSLFLICYSSIHNGGFGLSYFFRIEKPMVTIRRNDYNEIRVFRTVNEITNDIKLAYFRQNISALLVHCSMIVSLSSVCFAKSVFFNRGNVNQFDCYSKHLKL